MKYGSWNVSEFDQREVDQLYREGFSPLTARVLSSRGWGDPEKAKRLLSVETDMPSPLLMRDMERAANRVREALRRQEYIAVFGDYDVDGITATCMLTEFLRSQGGHVTYHIPGRLEEGYGLNEGAIRELADEGVTLIITVDCGITAEEEARYCLTHGIDLIITDHHECREELPPAYAVVNPHRKDHTYPHQNLAGVGVAFKLAAAVINNQTAILNRYSDFLCMGTVADVMPLVGENRMFVARGLENLSRTTRPGVLALMNECGCDRRSVTASTIGYTLAPRINAAGRLGRVELATELFLTQDPQRAAELAKMLCQLNRQRQEVEADIYREAVEMLPSAHPDAIVLAKETWHQGVVGIVASRLAEEYGCPAYLICLDGDRGKASSRSYGGFNLFESLEQLEPLLESYGGHELAAGFTICRSEIDSFRTGVERLARVFAESGRQKSALEIDCAVEPELLTEKNILALEQLEPCGSGCPRPVFFMDRLTVTQLSEVGGGRHLRLRLSRDGHQFGAIFFSTTMRRSGIDQGDCVEVAFTPQINEYRGIRSVQLNLVDIRPDTGSRNLYARDKSLYSRFSQEEQLNMTETTALLPERQDFKTVWRYLEKNAARLAEGQDFGCMSRSIARESRMECFPGKLHICLDVFRERGLLDFRMENHQVYITLYQPKGKVDLEQSPILIRLRQQKAGN